MSIKYPLVGVSRGTSTIVPPNKLGVFAVHDASEFTAEDHARILDGPMAAAELETQRKLECGKLVNNYVSG